MCESTAAVRGPDDHAPPRRVRWLFWAILGAFSVFFAEVTIGSMMFPFVDPFGLLVTCPLYGLHILVLSTLVLKRGRASFASLFFAGNLFGLYEAYITKALWNPPWHTALGGRVGGVGVLEAMILVLFWHAIMSFLVPLVAAERFLTSSTAGHRDLEALAVAGDRPAVAPAWSWRRCSDSPTSWPRHPGCTRWDRPSPAQVSSSA